MPAAAPGSLEQSASTSFKRRSKSLVSIARTKVSTTAAVVAASPGVITPAASAEVTTSSRERCRQRSRSAARRTSPCVRGTAAGCVRCTAATRSGRRPAPVRRPCGSTPRPPPRAVTQRRWSSCCGSRPGGRGDCPTGLFRTAAPRTRPGVFGESSSVIDVSLVQRAGPSRNRSSWEYVVLIGQFRSRHHRSKTKITLHAIGSAPGFPSALQQ